jgi:hypothetical protein
VVRKHWWWIIPLIFFIGQTIAYAHVPYLDGAFDITVTAACVGWYYKTHSVWPLILLIISGLGSLPDMYHDAVVGNFTGIISAAVWIGIGAAAAEQLFRHHVRIERK